MNTLAFISNLVGQDGWILLIIILIFFGAKRLPELARGAGQAIREFNKAKDEFEREITKPGQEVKVQPPQGNLPYTPPAPAATPVAPQEQVAQNPAPATPPSTAPHA
jgi:sec-independent protein translocase protein TatA